MSSFINVPQRLKVPAEQWRTLLWQTLCDLRVAIPGIVQSFDATKQTVTVQPAIRENINRNLVPTPETLPLLINVPIVVPRGGGYAITTPIQAGDECLVIFADMCMDAWWQSSGVQNQLDRRRHDLADGIAIVGLWSQPNVLPNYSTDSIQVRNQDGSKLVEITSDGINIVGGHINISGSSVTIEGKDFLTHQHSGVQTGGGVTGGVV